MYIVPGSCTVPTPASLTVSTTASTITLTSDPSTVQLGVLFVRHKAATTNIALSMPVPISSKYDEAFETCVAALGPDMPLLMHGAGDVIPEHVDPASAALVARLTTDYITKLCSAAVVDAHDILTDGAGGMLPPPALEKKLHPMSYFDELKHKKRKIPGEEYWDDPLPNPNIKGISKPSKQQAWVGLNGVDFYQASRSRKRHIQQAIDAQSFVFPICHDAELYQRVVQLQAARGGNSTNSGRQCHYRAKYKKNFPNRRRTRRMRN